MKTILQNLTFVFNHAITEDEQVILNTIATLNANNEIVFEQQICCKNRKDVIFVTDLFRPDNLRKFADELEQMQKDVLSKIKDEKCTNP